ncbi:MAG: hypothetical protein ONB13_02945 [candidate division KSB1 bacterium]|nr:hypothetical protein [candidate division KSB1 bacterium]MDZ7398697.1 hypothetical protein [candidate division KSB1 bacterium]
MTIIFEQNKLGRFVAVALVLISVAQTVYFHPKLQPQVASHFNLMMQPDKWSSKNSVMAFHLGITFGTAVLLYFLSWIIGKLPPAWLNLPNKHYWLSSERKRQTITTLATFLIWLGNVVLLFLIVTFNLIYQANLISGQKIKNFWVALVLFLVTIGFMIYHLFKHFGTVAGSR